jgi:hypothetical protein
LQQSDSVHNRPAPGSHDCVGVYRRVPHPSRHYRDGWDAYPRVVILAKPESPYWPLPLLPPAAPSSYHTAHRRVPHPSQSYCDGWDSTPPKSPANPSQGPHYLPLLFQSVTKTPSNAESAKSSPGLPLLEPRTAVQMLSRPSDPQIPPNLHQPNNINLSRSWHSSFPPSRIIKSVSKTKQTRPNPPGLRI